jgi:uncharacterized protein (TIGR02246 family)
MAARTPAEICALFQRAMADGDLDAVLSVYDAEAVFVRESGEVTRTRDQLRQELAPLVATRPRFAYVVQLVAEAGDTALMHTDWAVTEPQPLQSRAIEVARRQADGTWRWLIGDPFTVGKRMVA